MLCFLFLFNQELFFSDDVGRGTGPKWRTRQVEFTEEIPKSK